MAFLQVSRRVDYALRAVIHLASGPERGGVSTIADIASRERLPRQFLEKIFQQLIRSGLVRSRRGPHGGYELVRLPEQTTFRHVIEAVEGPIALNVCVGEHPDCSLIGACGMNRVWVEGQRRVMDLFENTTIASVRHVIPVADQQASG